MKRTITTLALIWALALAPMSGFAGAGHSGHDCGAPTKPAKKAVSAVCPVMGNKIPDVSKAAGKSVYKGTTHYFCCKGCKPEFDKNPEKYIKKQAKKK